MKTSFAGSIASIIFLCIPGCEDTTPKPGAQRLAAPPTEQQDPGSPSNPGAAPAPGASNSVAPGSESLAPKSFPESPAPKSFPESPATTGGITQKAFLAAHARVMIISTDLLKTLDGVTDESSGQAAAPRIAELTSQWKNAAETATAAFLVVPEDQRSGVMHEAMQSSMTQLAEAGLIHGDDTVSQIQRIAKSPAGPVLQNELVALRDAFLTTRGPYSPVTARQRLEQKLGPVGSPLKTE